MKKDKKSFENNPLEIKMQKHFSSLEKKDFPSDKENLNIQTGKIEENREKCQMTAKFLGLQIESIPTKNPYLNLRSPVLSAVLPPETQLSSPKNLKKTLNEIRKKTGIQIDNTVSEKNYPKNGS